MARLRPIPRRRVIDVLKSSAFEEVRSGKHATLKKRVGTAFSPLGFPITMR